MIIMNYKKLICHSKPKRSFFIKNHQFPVCARCTGFYISIIVYTIYAYFFYINYDLKLIILSTILLLPSIIDGTTQFRGYRESNNFLRLISGLLGGIGLMIILKSLKWIIYLKLIG